jgi:hypothetical protein
MLYMKTNQTSSRLDRFVDLLLDKKHPFWKDERQRAVYHEASTAALSLQSILVTLIASIGILIAGVKVIWLVIALVLTVSATQFLIMAILSRRHVNLFPSGWQKQTSRNRKIFPIAVNLFFLACVLFAMLSDGKDWDRSTIAGMLVGGLTGAGVTLGAVHYFKRKMAR